MKQQLTAPVGSPAAGEAQGEGGQAVVLAVAVVMHGEEVAGTIIGRLDSHAAHFGSADDLTAEVEEGAALQELRRPVDRRGRRARILVLQRVGHVNERKAPGGALEGALQELSHLRLAELLDDFRRDDQRFGGLVRGGDVPGK